MLKVEVISHETMKPYSPTPPHLQTHTLSWLDQHAPPSHAPLILFYHHNSPSPKFSTAHQTLSILKKSLSQTLTLFYPLAGRLNPNSPPIFVDCNDQGVEFLEAHTDSPLSQLLQHQSSDLETLSNLLPCHGSCSGSGGPLLSLQLTLFSCGGFSIGSCISHKIADGISLANFIAAWATTARGGSSADVERPTFNTTSLFPPSPDAVLPQAPRILSSNPTEKLVTKRFVFDESKIAILREGSRSPTRFEAVAALIWRCGMRARANSDPPRVSLALVVVNMRARAMPPLPESAFGNLCTYAAASEVEAKDEGAKLRVEEKLRSAIKKIDREHVRQLQGVDGPTLAFETAREAGRVYGKSDEDAGDIDLYYFNSWVRFPVYEADFGWRKPVWVGIARFFWKNLVLLMGRGVDGGMEAWVTLKEEEMEEFERDGELISYASSPASIVG